MAGKLQSLNSSEGARERGESVEAMLRSGVPLWKIEARLDYNDNRLPPVSGKRPVPNSRIGHQRATIQRGLSVLSRLFHREHGNVSRTA